MERISASEARGIALSFLSATRSAETATECEVLSGSTRDSPYAAYKSITEECEDCWLIVVRSGMGTMLDGPVTIVWISCQTGKVVGVGKGQDGG